MYKIKLKNFRYKDKLYPNWQDHLILIWQEDDATLHDPNAEKVKEACKRIFGFNLGKDYPKIIAKANWGDTGGDLYRNGVFVGWSYCGSFLSVLATVEIIKT